VVQPYESVSRAGSGEPIIFLHEAGGYLPVGEEIGDSRLSIFDFKKMRLDAGGKL
jgi:hypothetical protein